MRAEDAEIGQTVVVEGAPQRIEGWFLDARGRVMLLYGNRWHRHHRGDRLEEAL